MPNYKRMFVPGGCWFFTVNLYDRRSRLLTEHIGCLREAIDKVRLRYPFDVDAEVVLPDNLHAIWTLPPGDSDFPIRWRLIKTHFAKALPATEPRTAVHLARGERAIWQRRYWEHLIADEADWDRHVEYLLLQSGQAWFGGARRGLASLDLPSGYLGGFRADRLVSCQDDQGRVRRAIGRRMRDRIEPTNRSVSAMRGPLGGGLRFANPPYVLSTR